MSARTEKLSPLGVILYLIILSGIYVASIRSLAHISSKLKWCEICGSDTASFEPRCCTRTSLGIWVCCLGLIVKRVVASKSQWQVGREIKHVHHITCQGGHALPAHVNHHHKEQSFPFHNCRARNYIFFVCFLLYIPKNKDKNKNEIMFSARWS